MMKLKLFVLAALLIVAGVGLFVWEPAGPEAECAKKFENITGSESPEASGFVDKEKNCQISIESWQRIQESKTGPQWDNIGGLVLVVGGLGAGIVGAVRKSKPAA
jgi:hypothetical protein